MKSAPFFASERIMECEAGCAGKTMKEFTEWERRREYVPEGVAHVLEEEKV